MLGLFSSPKPRNISRNLRSHQRPSARLSVSAEAEDEMRPVQRALVLIILLHSGTMAAASQLLPPNVHQNLNSNLISPLVLTSVSVSRKEAAVAAGSSAHMLLSMSQ